MFDTVLRLDANESAFFKRELEHVETQVYETKYAPLKSRVLIPTLTGIPDWARVHTWREVDYVGAAQFISNAANDLPRADTFRTENSKMIKWLGSSYGYDLQEVKAAAAMGTPLDADRARAARRSIDTQIDDVLATGSAAHNLQGLLNLSSTSTYTVADKARGGKTWGTMAAPNATADEVAADIMGIATYGYTVTKEVWSRFVIAMPIEQFAYASQIRLGDTQVTALQFAKATCPFIEDVVPWLKCDGAGASSTDRMVAFPRTTEVLGAIVPMEFQPQPVERRNLAFTVNCIASTGGVVCKAPVAVVYADGI